MGGSKDNPIPIDNDATKSPKEHSGDESEDESEVLEESPCGRWLKRKEEVIFSFSD